MGDRDFVLFNWKKSKERQRQVVNWYGEELGEDELNKLCVGDCVRLMLMQIDGEGWERIYFEIIKINYYKKGSLNIPRTFFGKAMNTYRIYSEENLPYVKTGQVISFQKNNIVEIPKWNFRENPLVEQKNAKKVDAHLDYLWKHRYDDE